MATKLRAVRPRVTKAVPVEEPTYLHDIADRYQPRLARALQDVLSSGIKPLATSTVVGALGSGDATILADALLGPPSPESVAVLEAVLADLWMHAAEDTGLVIGETAGLRKPVTKAKGVAPKVSTDWLAVGMRFDVLNPMAKYWAGTHAAKLIVGLDDEKRKGIRTLVAAAFADGVHPYQLAPHINKLITLTPNQQAYVLNYTKALTAAKLSGGDPRKLKNHWTLSPTVPKKLGDVSAHIDTYAKRLQRWRSETIARTEVMRASNAGAYAQWKYAASMGYLDLGVARIVWSAHGDDRLCAICAAMDGVTVGFDTDFVATEQWPQLKASTAVPLKSPITVKHPPLHPNCRCVTVIDPFGDAGKPVFPKPEPKLPKVPDPIPVAPSVATPIHNPLGVPDVNAPKVKAMAQNVQPGSVFDTPSGDKLVVTDVGPSPYKPGTTKIDFHNGTSGYWENTFSLEVTPPPKLVTPPKHHVSGGATDEINVGDTFTSLGEPGANKTVTGVADAGTPGAKKITWVDGNGTPGESIQNKGMIVDIKATTAPPVPNAVVAAEKLPKDMVPGDQFSVSAQPTVNKTVVEVEYIDADTYRIYYTLDNDPKILSVYTNSKKPWKFNGTADWADPGAVPKPAIPKPPAPARALDAPPFRPDQLTLDEAETKLLGGQGVHSGKQVYSDPNGDLWLFKPAKPGEEWRAYVDEATAKLQARVGLSAPDTYVTTMGGKTGSLQKVWGTKDTRRMKFSKNFDATKVDAADAMQLEKNKAFDWLIGNNDNHEGQFVRLSGTKDIKGIDKGQAFKHYEKDRLDWDYDPSVQGYDGHRHIYNELHRAYVQGRTDVVPDLLAGDARSIELRDFLKSMSDIPDEEVRAILRPYAEAAHRRGVLAYGDIETFLDRVVERKNTIQGDWAKYHARMKAERDKVLGTPATANAPPGAKGMPKFGDADLIDFWNDVDIGETANRKAVSFGTRRMPKVRQIATSEELDAAQRYTGSYAGSLNDALRAGDAASSSYHGPYIRNLDSLIAKSPTPTDVIVYRAVPNRFAEKFVGNIPPGQLKDRLVGQVIHDDAYLSSSLGNSPGLGADADVWLRIRVPKGHPMAWVKPISQHTKERETLLARGQKMYVHDVRYEDRPRGGRGYVVDCEIIAE